MKYPDVTADVEGRTDFVGMRGRVQRAIAKAHGEEAGAEFHREITAHWDSGIARHGSREADACMIIREYVNVKGWR